MKAFTGDQLAALLIGERLRVPICDHCHRFATHCASSDVCCDQHIEQMCTFFHRSPQEVVKARLFEIADRLNALLWPDPKAKPMIDHGEDEDVGYSCNLYGCDNDGACSFESVNGGRVTLCEAHRPKS